MKIDAASLAVWIQDAIVRDGVRFAIEKALAPALDETIYPGHFLVEADGAHFGVQWSFPGLDAWEMSSAYLAMGLLRPVLDFFDFAQASQRADGHIPFAVVPANDPVQAVDGLRNVRYPEDVFEYTPVHRQGRQPNTDSTTNKWVGLYEHWVPNNPLGVLAPISLILTATEIVKFAADKDWLAAKMTTLVRAAEYVYSLRDDNGLIGGAGFYVELHSRYKWDGTTQCYAIHAFRQIAAFYSLIDDEPQRDTWSARADALADVFNAMFWRDDHYGEYVHPEHGLVDLHGLSDVNWAAIGLNISDDVRSRALWQLMCDDPLLWRGDFPSQLVSKPYLFRDWELGSVFPAGDPNLGPLHDVAAMGRVWYLELLAGMRMGDHTRVTRSVELVCEMGQRHDWYWSERYQPLQTWGVNPAGSTKYCEYPAILVQFVLSNRSLFDGSSPSISGVEVSAS